MIILGIMFMTIGVTFSILHARNRDAFGMLTAGLAFISGLIAVLTNQG